MVLKIQTQSIRTHHTKLQEYHKFFIYSKAETITSNPPSLTFLEHIHISATVVSISHDRLLPSFPRVKHIWNHIFSFY